MNISLVSFLDVPYDLQMKTREWRNSEQVTKYFRIPHITEEQHKKWLASLHNNPPSTIAFMIMDDAEPVGVTYFHSINYDAKVTKLAYESLIPILTMNGDDDYNLAFAKMKALDKNALLKYANTKPFDWSGIMPFIS